MTDSIDHASNQTAAEFFGARIPEYDSLIRRAVPGYEELTAALVAELPTAAGTVLELGCGTGNLSLRLAARYPAASITFVDASADMVAVTAARVKAADAALAARSSFHVGRFEELDLPAASFDVVTSAIALHHVEQKAPLYRRMHGLLKPGGRCCFADQLRMGHQESQEYHWQRFLAFWHQPGHLNAAEVAELLAHSAAHDHYETLEHQFALLRSAGFSELDAPWRVGLWGLISATA